MNSRSSGANKEYATVDEQPSGSTLGYWTNTVCLRDKIKDGLSKGKMYFSVRESETDSSGASDTSAMTVVLQFQCEGDLGWQDYNHDVLDAGDRFILEDFGAGVHWRAGIKDGDYTSGKLTFGFDW